eukprot:COSAG06_NODE_48573_length_331_cov_0.672414_1_plen_85_part_01
MIARWSPKTLESTIEPEPESTAVESVADEFSITWMTKQMDDLVPLLLTFYQKHKAEFADYAKVSRIVASFREVPQRKRQRNFPAN